MKEAPMSSRPGIPVLFLMLVLTLAVAAAFVYGANTRSAPVLVGTVLVSIVVFFAWFGFYMVEPNQSAVLSLFGKYVGTVKDQGLRWNNPFYSKKKISLRVRNFESGKLKINELDGSPIEIAAVIVWQVVDSAEAVFNVDDYQSFVHIQSESALRAMASSYPYDQHEDGQIALRSHPQEISQHLQEQIQERLSKAGVDVIEARISHLAYAAEIAQAMLQRQQANAVVAARTRIVFGAVSMVQMALEELKKSGVMELDEERRAAMVSNLLVVLCSDRATQPVVNTGSLY
ncbi:SPFH domain-containing protein [Chiayiivirga flava]|uniref:Regulator of protease activity HflC (Stomatin/prohibitin superfamily) n=1 Tax=Chiayiivirga flava TaxID=659595 RepID=A0A7W8D5V8_9GAMM|nr:SPFH domain-containing protein [Chiayiivirga flava]MBB5208465.1 regulator of protease activity HflC (stomatin/prohibitin superfamily) [Chiayiivirga flava]